MAPAERRKPRYASIGISTRSARIFVETLWDPRFPACVAGHAVRMLCTHGNRPDDEEYIVRLVGQVVRVSVETVKIVKALPKSYGGS